MSSMPLARRVPTFVNVWESEGRGHLWNLDSRFRHDKCSNDSIIYGYQILWYDKKIEKHVSVIYSVQQGAGGTYIHGQKYEQGHTGSKESFGR